MPTAQPTVLPHTIRMHALDNVEIVANDGGLPPGTVLADGLVLHDRVPQGHKVAMANPSVMQWPILQRAVGCTSACCTCPVPGS
jgi:galactarate dehydratase